MTQFVERWIEIFDFRPGIVSSGGHVAQTAKPSIYAPLGAATPETYNCYAHPISGALEPLPKLQNGPTLTNDQISTAVGPNNADACVILDAMVLGSAPRYEWVDATKRLDNAISDSLWVLEGRYVISGGSAYWVTRGRHYKIYKDNVTVETTDFQIQSSSTAAATTSAVLPIPFNSVTYGRCSTTTSSCTVGDLRTVVAAKVSSSPWVDNTGTIGSPFAGYTTYDSDVSSSYPPNIGMYPNPATPTLKSTTATAINGYQTERGWLVVHQGRLIHVNNAVKSNLAATNEFVFNDQLDYTAANRFQVIGGSVIADEGNPAGYGTGGSFNANSLLLIKHFGGGVSIRGSLDNPQVVKLPALESTHGWNTKGTMTPLGFVYLTPTGVWAYQDNTDASKLISVQLENYVFDYKKSPSLASGLTNLSPQGWRGSLTYWHPFILVPNNWIFDIRTQSWWRMGQPNQSRPTIWWMTSATSDRLYALPVARTTSSTESLWQYADWDTLNGTYEWWSQNIVPQAIGRLYQPTTVQIHGTLHPSMNQDVTITITIRGFTENAQLIEDSVQHTIEAGAAKSPFQENIAIVASAKRYATMSIGIKVETTSFAPNITGVRIGMLEHSDIPYNVTGETH